jgi:hypothetical protein
MKAKQNPDSHGFPFQVSENQKEGVDKLVKTWYHSKIPSMK